jgi:hypothetical protein
MVLDWFVAILDCRSLEDTGTGSHPRAEPEDDAHSSFGWHRDPITRCQVRCWWTVAWEATARAERCCHVMRAVFQFQTTIWIQYFFLFLSSAVIKGKANTAAAANVSPAGTTGRTPFNEQHEITN